MCDCKNTVLARIKDDVVKNLPPHVEGSVSSSFRNTMIRFDQKPNDVAMIADVHYRRTKQDGTEHKRENVKSVTVFMSYCPFCGEKYPETQGG